MYYITFDDDDDDVPLFTPLTLLPPTPYIILLLLYLGLHLTPPLPLTSVCFTVDVITVFQIPTKSCIVCFLSFFF